MGVTEKLHKKGERSMVTARLGEGRREEQDKRLSSLEPHKRTAQGSSRESIGHCFHGSRANVL